MSRLEKEGILLELAQRLKTDRQVAVRKESLQMLAVLDMGLFAGEIAGALQDPASEMRIAAVEALGQIEDPAIQGAIEALAQDPVEAVRNAVKRRRLKTVK